MKLLTDKQLDDAARKLIELRDSADHQHIGEAKAEVRQFQFLLAAVVYATEQGS